MARPDDRALWVDSPDGSPMLCLKMEATDDLLSHAHNLLDDTLARLCPHIRRLDLIEADATAALNEVRNANLWLSESFGLKYSTPDGSHQPTLSAVGVGGNQKLRKRVVALSFAVAVIVHNSGSPQVPYLFSAFAGLRNLATLCFQRKSLRLEQLAETLGQTPALARPSAVPSVSTVPERQTAATLPQGPVESMSPPEKVMALARHFGAEEMCVVDPYLTVDEQNSFVLCAACNKHMNAAHILSKKHQGYLGNIQETLLWIRQQGGRPCLRMLQEQSGDSWAAYSAPAYTAPTGSATPWATPGVPAQAPQAAERQTQVPIPRKPEFTPPPTEMPSMDEMLDFWLWMRDQRFGSLEQRGGGKWIHFGPDDEDDDGNYDECWMLKCKKPEA